MYMLLKFLKLNIPITHDIRIGGFRSGTISVKERYEHIIPIVLYKIYLWIYSKHIVKYYLMSTDL